MSDARDPAIKLFGKTIPLSESAAPAAVSVSSEAPLPSSDVGTDVSFNNDPSLSPNSSSEDPNSNEDAENQQSKDSSAGKSDSTKREDASESVPSDTAEENMTPAVNDSAQTPSDVNEDDKPEILKTEEEQSEAGNSQEKTVKKPDKLLPCPRCNSMDTKFCYYNNYNVNQPRHFCKNCQRYWTAGGTMRNVPVGAGRRKNKSSVSQCRHIAASEALQNTRVDIPNGVHHAGLMPSGTVLAFCSDNPLCESMASALNIVEKTMQNHARNEIHKPEESRVPVTCGGEENGDDLPTGSLVTAANSVNDMGNIMPQYPLVQNCHSFPPIACFPGAPWPYPWNSAQWSSAVAAPAFCPTGFPMPFYPPPAYWGCTVPGTWNGLWVTPSNASVSQIGSSSGPDSPTLGKHSRDENTLKEPNSEEERPLLENNPKKCLWIPKTLRIDDPREAAKSSIWATLGISKNEKSNSISGGGLFKPFQVKGEEKNHISKASSVLQANPAALSRSVDFHESS